MATGEDWAVEVGEVKGCSITWAVLWESLSRAEANELVARYERGDPNGFRYRAVKLDRR